MDNDNFFKKLESTHLISKFHIYFWVLFWYRESVLHGNHKINHSQKKCYRKGKNFVVGKITKAIKTNLIRANYSRLIPK